jgi:hypothetical protein
VYESLHLVDSNVKMELQLVYVSDGMPPEAKLTVNGVPLPAVQLCTTQSISIGDVELWLTPVQMSSDTKDGRVTFAVKAIKETGASTVLAGTCEPASDAEMSVIEGARDFVALGSHNVELTTLYVADDATSVKVAINGAVQPNVGICQTLEAVLPVGTIRIVPTKITGGNPGSALLALKLVEKGSEAAVATGSIPRGGDGVVQISAPSEPSPAVQQKNLTFNQNESNGSASAQPSGTGALPPSVAPTCSGCMLDGACVPVGYRAVLVGAVFCSPNGDLVPQVADASMCQNNFECASNQCLNAVCVSVEKDVKETNSLLQQLFTWFKELF